MISKEVDYTSIKDFYESFKYELSPRDYKDSDDDDSEDSNETLSFKSDPGSPEPKVLSQETKASAPKKETPPDPVVIDLTKGDSPPVKAVKVIRHGNVSSEEEEEVLSPISISDSHSDSSSSSDYSVMPTPNVRNRRNIKFKPERKAQNAANTSVSKRGRLRKTSKKF